MMMFSHLPKFVFFTGKGGVGKTSLACATALNLADTGKRVLLVSTDPASNVGQVMQTEIGDRLTPIKGVERLDAIEIDPEAAATAYRERIVGPVRGQLPEAELKAIIEQLSGACTTEIAAFDEFTALLTDHELIDRYDHVIFDTAPTGHTIRLLKLPGAWSGFLEAGKGDASCLGPLSGLEQQRDRYAAAVASLADAASTLLVLVARPQRSALAEAARTASELSLIGINNQHLALNGVMPETGDDPLAAALRKREQQAIDEMPDALHRLPQSSFALRAFNLMGLAALRILTGQTDESEYNAKISEGERPDADLQALGALVDQLESSGKGLIMLMGKGGVGKTTIAAAVAAELAGRGHEVLLTTTDPAAHLTETLGEELEHLTVSRIDPAEEIARYRTDVMASKGKDLDEQGRAMLEEDLRSPCTEEIAVFQAFSRLIRKSSRQFVVMDTAPTGHTLLLLDATGSYHRDIMRHAATGSKTRMITPMMRLQDPEMTRILIVTLAETTPVLEAAHLQADLRRAGIEPWAWVVNASVAAAQTSDPLLQKRAASELPQIAAVSREHATRYAVVPLQAVEPTGAVRLRALCHLSSGTH
ncbi:arsenical pump-driving ATPase [Nitrincola alkalilacustris]|uniref:arsenical pump-driving ATPase n=1 Tax=Nitrincola alkalilacustris TaxID=1571224 RepID=UPI00124C6E3A